MKIFTLLLLFCASALLAQETPPDNYAVQFYGAGNEKGYPQFWPKSVQSVGTNEVAPTGWVWFSASAYANLIYTNQAAMQAAKSNRLWQTKQTVDANVAALVTAYSNLQWAEDHWEYVTNLNNLKVAVKAEGDVLLKLKPVLKELYKGE